MTLRTTDSARRDTLRRGSLALSRLAWWVQAGIFILGIGLFLDQGKDLLSDSQFTWGERRVMGLAAAVTLGGCLLAGWVLGQLIRVAAEVLEMLADQADAAWRTCELIETHLVPTLGRIALVLEERAGAAEVGPGPSAGPSHGLGPAAMGTEATSLRTELAAARTACRAGRVIDLRDALTQHLRGESLHALDRELALWIQGLVDHRVRAGTVDAELAGWVSRALDSLGAMTETDPLRTALPALRRAAGLCTKCGRPVRGAEPLCAACQPRQAAAAGGRQTDPPTSTGRRRSR